VGRLPAAARVGGRTRAGRVGGPGPARVSGRQKSPSEVGGGGGNLGAGPEGDATPGGILVCRPCRSRLDGEFRFEPFGTIDIRGLGACETWFIAGPKSADSGADTGSDGATGEPIQLQVTHPN